MRETVAVASGAEVELYAIQQTFWVWKRRSFSAVVDGSVQAIAEITLTVPPGQFMCIVGPSGCGKSTLLNIVAGFVRATSGSVAIDKRPVTGTGHPGMAMVFQQIGLFPWRTALENVMFPLEEAAVSLRRNRRQLRSTRRVEAMDALRMVNLEGAADRYPHELSGGMRQRVAIARALVVKPRLILMDEPFGALDAQTRMRLQDELLALHATWGGTIIFVTHDIDEAVYLSDRVIVMSSNPGRITGDIPIDLPRPRHPLNTRADPTFSQLRSRIWELLHADYPGTLSDGANAGALESMSDSVAL